MSFDLANIDQSQKWIDTHLFLPMYQEIAGTPNAVVLRFLGPPIGLTDALLSLMQSVAGVAEALLKGSINLVGSSPFNECNAYRGLLQVCLGAPVIGVSTIPIVASRFLKITGSMIVEPHALAHQEVDRYQRELREYLA